MRPVTITSMPASGRTAMPRTLFQITPSMQALSSLMER